MLSETLVVMVVGSQPELKCLSILTPRIGPLQQRKRPTTALYALLFIGTFLPRSPLYPSPIPGQKLLLRTIDNFRDARLKGSIFSRRKKRKRMPKKAGIQNRWRLADASTAERSRASVCIAPACLPPAQKLYSPHVRFLWFQVIDYFFSNSHSTVTGSTVCAQ